MTRAKPVKSHEAEPEQRDVNVLDQVVDKADVKVQVEVKMHPGNFTGPGPQLRQCKSNPHPVQGGTSSDQRGGKPRGSWKSRKPDLRRVERLTSSAKGVASRSIWQSTEGHHNDGPRGFTQCPLRLRSGRGEL